MTCGGRDSRQVRTRASTCLRVRVRACRPGRARARERRAPGTCACRQTSRLLPARRPRGPLASQSYCKSLRSLLFSRAKWIAPPLLENTLAALRGAKVPLIVRVFVLVHPVEVRYSQEGSRITFIRIANSASELLATGCDTWLSALCVCVCVCVCDQLSRESRSEPGAALNE